MMLGRFIMSTRLWPSSSMVANTARARETRQGLFKAPIRCMAARARKRFYRDVSLASSNGGDKFEVLLDGRRVKTPLGNPLVVEGEMLARAVQQEWQAQKDLVVTQQMHLTGLCNACVDNPTGAQAETLADSILAYLDTDTVLYFSSDNEDLLRLQNEAWLPIVRWFCERHSIKVDPATSLLPPNFSPGARDVVRKYLLSQSLPCLHALAFGVDAVKSLVLTCAVIERKLNVEEAVSLARLEVQFQTKKWGNVEWSHDLERHDTTARLSAAALFVLLNNNHHAIKQKA